MKEYRWFILTFSILLAIYVVAEVNRPKELDWEVTLSPGDKNPYGGYCLYNMLGSLFPATRIISQHLPVVDPEISSERLNTAWLLLAPELLNLSRKEVTRLLHYAAAGNYLFISSVSFSKVLQDTLKFRTDSRFDFATKDSITINFTNPALHTSRNTGFRRMTLDKYFSSFDTLATTVLGDNQQHDANFIRMRFGKGFIFLHALPLCFSNNFLLTRDNASYTANALSYLPAGVSRLIWYEQPMPGAEGSDNPLRYILRNDYLRWAFRLGLGTMALFVLSGIKRRQRIIPVIEPLQNSTLDFVRTVGNIYFNKQDNKDIAAKMTSYLMEHIRTNFSLPTNVLDDAFVQSLAKKAGVPEKQVEELVHMIVAVQESDNVSDAQLLELNRQIDNFYEEARQGKSI